MWTLKLGDKMQPPVLVAELSYNHNFNKFSRNLYASAEAGADAIKLQTFNQKQ